MKKSKTRIIIIIIAVFISIRCILLLNYKMYGTWSLFEHPSYLYVNGLRYDSQNCVAILRGNDKPKYEISTITNLITGKRIYSFVRKAKNVKVVFMNVGKNQYLVFTWNGYKWDNC